MAKIKGKGSLLQLEIASVFTTISQMTSLDFPAPEVETFDGTCLDTTGPGKEPDPTGYADSGECGFELFFDPVLTVHQALTDLISAPAVVNWKAKFADAAVTVWSFAGILTKLSPSAKMNDGVKAQGTIKLKGIPTYPT